MTIFVVEVQNFVTKLTDILKKMKISLTEFNNKKIGIKPAIIKISPSDKGTNRRIIDDLLYFIYSRTHPAKVCILSGSFIEDVETILNDFSYFPISIKWNIETINLDKFTYKPITFRENEIIIKISKYVLENIDIILNIPRIKPLQKLFFLGALTNLMDLTNNIFSFFEEKNIDKISYILTILARKKIITIADCTNSQIFREQFILIGDNVIEIDAVIAALLGIPPKRIPYLVKGSKMNLGTIDIDKIEINGTTIYDLRKKVRKAYLRRSRKKAYI